MVVVVNDCGKCMDWTRERNDLDGHVLRLVHYVFVVACFVLRGCAYMGLFRSMSAFVQNIAASTQI